MGCNESTYMVDDIVIYNNQMYKIHRFLSNKQVRMRRVPIVGSAKYVDAFTFKIRHLNNCDKSYYDRVYTIGKRCIYQLYRKPCGEGVITGIYGRNIEVQNVNGSIILLHISDHPTSILVLP